MEKLKNRFDAFSDAIMAIIITIMVTDIPPALKDTGQNYLNLANHIGVFLISFIFIANIWYQHATAFSEINTMTYRILILDFIFLALLSLIPPFTNMMASNATRITVTLYGVLQVVVNLLFRYLSKEILHLRYTDRKSMQHVYQKIYGNMNRSLDILSLWDIVVAWFFPKVALIFYLLYPILIFLLNARARQEMYNVEILPEEEQQNVANLDHKELRKFEKAEQNIMTSAASNMTSETQKWLKWLDENVDPKQRQQLKERYDGLTAQQDQQVKKWFEQHQEERKK